MSGPYGVLPTGFSKPAQSDIQTDVNASVVKAFGPSINNVAPSVIATLTGVFTDREASLWDMGQGVYDSAYPDTAVGVSLDDAVALNGIRRLKATFSKQRQILLFGTVGTIIPKGTQFSVQDVAASVFATDAASAPLIAGVNEVQRLLFSAVPASGSFQLSLFNQVTALINYNALAADVAAALNALSALGGGVTVTGDFVSGMVITFAGVDGLQPQPLLAVETNTLQSIAPSPIGITPSVITPGVPQGIVTATATATGPIMAPALTLTVIDTPVGGLTRVLNYVDATPGTNIETDQQLRIRRANTIQIAGNATIDAIRSKLANLIGVVSVVPFENTTLLPDVNGRDPKSYEMVVYGGVDQDITQTMWNTKPGGIETDGNQSGTAIDIAGNPQPVKWSRPVDEPIYVIINITPDTTFPVDGAAVIAADVLAYGQALAVGESIYVQTKLIGSFSIVDGITDVEVLIGTTNPPTVANTFISIAPEKRALFESIHITVNIL